LKKCQILIDFLSALLLCNYEASEEEPSFLEEDDPFIERLYVLIDDYFESMGNIFKKIGYCLHAKFCEAKHLNAKDSVFIEARLCRVIHPAIADIIDSLSEKDFEIFISSLEEIYNLMDCVQKNSHCEKRSIILNLLKFLKASGAMQNFNNFLRKHKKKN